MTCSARRTTDVIFMLIRSFGGGYDPFYAEDGYTSTWSRRGLSSDNLKKEIEPIQENKLVCYYIINLFFVFQYVYIFSMINDKKHLCLTFDL